VGEKKCIDTAPVNGPIVMSPDDILMNMDYVGIIREGGDRKEGRKTGPNDFI
jgi:hypothetical protein